MHPKPSDDPIDALTLAECRTRLREVRATLWPDHDPDEPWSPDHLDRIGEVIEDLRCPTE